MPKNNLPKGWKSKPIQPIKKEEKLKLSEILMLMTVFLIMWLIILGVAFGSKDILEEQNKEILIIQINHLPISKDYLHIKPYIRQQAQRNDIDPDLAIKIARLESTFNPNAEHINKGGSIDLGLFQINSYWHPEVTEDCALDPKCNIDSAMKIAKARGWKEWSSYNKIK